jgi:hypothetical protein
LLFLGAACDVEHYQIIPDWTEAGEDRDVAGESAEEDVPDMESPDEEDEQDGEERDHREEEDDARGDAPIFCSPADAGDGGARCPTGQVCCDEEPADLCADLSDDRHHCGRCDQECDPDQECISGVCSPP